MSKQAKLDEIAEEIKKCTECQYEKIGEAVPGEGNPDADIVFVGEAPGKQEAKIGRPFIGRSGKYLRSLITGIGLKEEDVYITSPVKYLPKRGTPLPVDIAHGRTHLVQQFEVINPKTVVLLGRVAAEGVFGEKLEVMKEHGRILERNGKKYFLTIHPAAAIRFTKFRSIIKRDFEALRKII